MAPFAGYEMPISYPTGALEEHLICRRSVGLFDIDHMGQFEVSGAGADEFAGIASLGWTWDFKGPIFLGDTIHVRCSLRDKRKTKKVGRGIFYLALQVVNQRGEVLQEGEHRLMVETRENTQSAYV